MPEDAGPRIVPAWATSISAGPADESGQTLTFVVTNNNAALFTVQPSVAPDGTLTFQSAANANGQATVTVVLKDNGGTAGGGVDASAAQTFVITVSPVNDAPVLAPIGSRTVVFGTLLHFNAAATDVDRPAQTLTFSLTGAVPDGVLIDRRTGFVLWLPWFNAGWRHLHLQRAGHRQPGGVRRRDPHRSPWPTAGADSCPRTTARPIATGKVVPVKFRLTGVSGLIHDADARLYISRVVSGVPGPETPATPSSGHGEPVPVRPRRLRLRVQLEHEGTGDRNLSAPRRHGRRRASHDHHPVELRDRPDRAPAAAAVRMRRSCEDVIFRRRLPRLAAAAFATSGVTISSPFAFAFAFSVFGARIVAPSGEVTR